MPDPILYLKVTALNRGPSYGAGLVVVDIDDEPQKDNWEVPVKEFLEERAKIHLINGFGEIKKASEDFRIIPEIVRDCPGTLKSIKAKIDAQLSSTILS